MPVEDQGFGTELLNLSVGYPLKWAGRGLLRGWLSDRFCFSNTNPKIGYALRLWWFVKVVHLVRQGLES